MVFETDTNTKDFLAKAYQTVLSELEERARLLETPAETAERERRKALRDSVEKLLALGILNREITDEYEKSAADIKKKTAELEKLYEITVTTRSLTAVREASRRASEQFTQEDEEAERSFDIALTKQKEEADRAREENARELEEKIAAVKEEKEELEQSSTQTAERERAEYDYNLQRKRRLADEQRAQTVMERESALREREAIAAEKKEALLARAEEISALQKSVNDIPRQLEAAGKNGAAKKERQLSKAHGYQKALDDKDREHRIGALKAAYERLSEKYRILGEETAALSARLDQCNAESRKLTSDTVRSIGGINILNADAHPYGTAPQK